MKKIYLTLVSITILSIAHFVWASDASQRAIAYLLSNQQADGSFGTMGNSDWIAMAFGSFDYQNKELKDYLTTLPADQLTEATDIERHFLGLVASGVNPRLAQDDFVQILLDYFDGNQFGKETYINDDIFAIFALIAAAQVDCSKISSAANFIQSHQRPDGGFYHKTTGSEGDTDNTAVAIQAFLVAQKYSCWVPRSDVLDSAVGFLRTAQNNDGGFGFRASDESNLASTAWAIQALNALGQAQSGWQKDGNTPLSFLLSLQQEDGAFWLKRGKPGKVILMTSYGLMALSGRSLPVAIWSEPELPPTPTLTPISTVNPGQANTGSSQGGINEGLQNPSDEPEGQKVSSPTPEQAQTHLASLSGSAKGEDPKVLGSQNQSSFPWLLFILYMTPWVTIWFFFGAFVRSYRFKKEQSVNMNKAL